jgi:drug/metabolite transporter superfamily protein YnfA
MNFEDIGSAKLGAAAVFVAAAVLEVAGDALIRKGLRGGGMVLIAFGFGILGAYGVVVNLLHFDFSRLLGAYVGVFAVVSVVIGRVVFRDAVPISTWLGIAVILAGSAIIHFGRSSS